MRKIIIYFIFVSFFSCKTFGQQGMWVWMKGDSTNTSPTAAKYGTLNVPSATTNPAGVYEACEWKDKQGNFWLYGGVVGFNYQTSALFKYDLSLNQWTWKGGGGSTLPVHGTKGIPAANNWPGARGWGVQCWTDTTGKFWLFGGWGLDANGVQGCLNDLWKYDPGTSQWTWMSGSKYKCSGGYPGTKGVPSTTNEPRARNESNATWVDNNNLWLFGGLDSVWNSLNDVWRYNISTNEWTWMWGSLGNNLVPNYGIKGVASPTNDPGGRYCYTKHNDGSGNIYLFGAGNTYPSKKNDVWKYNIQNNEWTWVAGVDTLYYKGIYTSKCDLNSLNQMPAAKYEMRSCWSHSAGVYFFGGEGNVSTYAVQNDLWHFDPSGNKFTWISGGNSNNPYTFGIYGTKGLAAPQNIPSSRNGSSSWTDNVGNLWMYGGLYWDTIGPMNNMKFKNDLWKYYPNPDCITEPVTTHLNHQNSESKKEFSVYPNPSTGCFSIVSSGNDNTQTEIIIYDITGKIVYKEEFSELKRDFDLKLIDGLYVVNIRTSTSAPYNCKLLISHY